MRELQRRDDRMIDVERRGIAKKILTGRLTDAVAVRLQIEDAG
jgi:hypothetical protein